jgi:flavin reductase (DIM6/NTAB) family NADH-FMN oxidoreductase RutF
MDDSLASAFASLTTGIYVLTVAEGSYHHGMSSSWVTQVSGDPPLFSAAVDNAHLSRAIIDRTGRFGLNVIGTGDKQLEDYFYSTDARRPDNLSGLAYDLSPMLNVPWLQLAMVAIEAKVQQTIVAGDHTIYIASPLQVRVAADDRPLTSLDLEYVYLGGRIVIPRGRHKQV